MLTELGKQREAGSGWKQSLFEGAKSAAGSGLMTLGKQMEKRKAEEPPAPGTPRWAAGGPFWKRIPLRSVSRKVVGGKRGGKAKSGKVQVALAGPASSAVANGVQERKMGKHRRLANWR